MSTHLPPEHEGTRLRTAREARDLSQVKLAKKARVSLSSVCRHEQSGSIPLAPLRKYCRALRVTEQWVRYGLGSGPSDDTSEIVEKYLKTPMGKTCDPEIAQLLRRVPYASLAVQHLTLVAVHRVRELIEMNRLLATPRDSDSLVSDDPAPRSQAKQLSR